MMHVLAMIQVGGAVPTSAFDLIRSSSPVTRVVLIFLLVLSLVSWAIMLAKWIEFHRITKHGREFVYEFERMPSLDAAANLTRRAKSNPFTRVFTRALNFFAELKPGALKETVATPLRGSQVEALRLVLESESATQRDQLSSYIPWLATIGSVSPLVGLFGTVLGVIHAFIGIAVSGSGNLSAVAPGVAEALTATAAALAVAIPAVFGYNICAARLNRLESELEGFGTEILAMMVREGRI